MDTMDKSEKQYSNGKITIVWKPNLCTHVANCFTELPEVFDPSERPWINPNGATTEKIINQIKRCPTGALTFFYNNNIHTKQLNTMEKEIKTENTQTRVEIIANGPAVIKGKCTMVDKNGIESETEPVFAICRCSKSKNKPFCDGSHITNPFE